MRDAWEPWDADTGWSVAELQRLSARRWSTGLHTLGKTRWRHVMERGQPGRSTAAEAQSLSPGWGWESPDTDLEDVLSLTRQALIACPAGDTWTYRKVAGLNLSQFGKGVSTDAGVHTTDKANAWNHEAHWDGGNDQAVSKPFCRLSTTSRRQQTSGSIKIYCTTGSFALPASNPEPLICFCMFPLPNSRLRCCTLYCRCVP